MKEKVIIIGAGVAGMSAAMHLINSGFTVEILESTNKIGGRCFSFFDKNNFNKINNFNNIENNNKINNFNKNNKINKIENSTNKINKKLFEIDNGQHLFSDAYKEFFELVKWLGNENVFSERKNLKIDFIELNKKQNFNYQLDCTKFNGLAGFVYGLLKMKGIDIFDKIFNAVGGVVLLNILFKNLFKKDISTFDFFQKTGTTKQTIERLWKPMVVAISNSPIEKASTKLFINTLRKILTAHNNGFSLLHSKVPLSKIFDNFLEKIDSSGNKIFFNSTVNGLIVENGICKGIVKNNSEKIYSDYVISTVQPHQLAKIDNSFSKFKNIFTGSPIISAYLWLEQPIIQGKYVSCINSNIEWIFNKNNLLEENNFFEKTNILEISDFENLQQIALTVSAANNLISLDIEALQKIIETEIKQIFNDENSNSKNINNENFNNKNIKILAHRIIKDKNATSLITFENNILRPKTRTEISNFFLAGDWIQTDLPATIESAALSGKLSTVEIIKNPFDI
jgi:zeta-carotene desaturase